MGSGGGWRDTGWVAVGLEKYRVGSGRRWRDTGWVAVGLERETQQWALYCV